MSMDEHKTKPAGTNVGPDVCPTKRKQLDLATAKEQIEHQIEQVGAKLRAMMPWIAKNALVDKTRN